MTWCKFKFLLNSLRFQDWAKKMLRKTKQGKLLVLAYLNFPDKILSIRKYYNNNFRQVFAGLNSLPFTCQRQCTIVNCKHFFSARFSIDPSAFYLLCR
jgi:hypothetical protein